MILFGFGVLSTLATGGDGDGGGTPPSNTAPAIADLKLARTSANYAEGGGKVIVRAELSYTDAEADVTTVTFEISDGSSLVTIAVSSPNTSGSVSSDLEISTRKSGVLDISVSVADRMGNRSNTLRETFTIFGGARLEGLSLAAGDLVPAFDPSVFAYSAQVAFLDAATTLTATLEDPAALLSVNDTPAASGVASDAVALRVGETVVTIEVAAEPGGLTNTYTVVVARPNANNVWVATDDAIRLLSPNGAELVTISSVFGTGFGYNIGFEIMDADPTDGGLWVADVNEDRVFKLDHAGTPLFEVALSSPLGAWVDPSDGGLWTSELKEVQGLVSRELVKLSRAGQEVVRVGGFGGLLSAISGDASRGNLWVADRLNDEVVLLFTDALPASGYAASASTGPNHLRFDGFVEPTSVSATQGAAEAWVGNRHPGEAVKLSSTTELLRVAPSTGGEVRQVVANPVDGSVWLRAANPSDFATKLSSGGVEETTIELAGMTAIEMDAEHEVIWIGAGQSDGGLTVAAFSPAGAELHTSTLPALEPGFNVLVRDIAVQRLPP